MSDSVQSDPLKPGYDFNAHMVAGLTPIEAGEELDFTIDRPAGMKGYILNMTIKGCGTVFHGEDSFDVKEGDLLLLPPGVPHFYHRKADSLAWHHRWIYFRPRAYWNNRLKWQQCINGVYYTKGMLLEDRIAIEALFAQVEELGQHSDPYSDELRLNLLEQILIRCKMNQPCLIKKRVDPRISEVIHYISSRLNEDVSNEQLAKLICLSPSRLGHLFRDEIGMTITQWRDDQRISRAKQLLVTSNYSINQISRLIGYSDPLYFSRVFKKKAGLSPKLYRDKLM
ncbi:arabinose operon transcriptional regulator AraC [Photobacterium rosenbergii]|uniref:Arabinose operon transcriptional regulator AraC n=1 Tax=Photobacterium rosenbergii TaxID=294936 RepID=A0ABU3ZII4_9GAMM|nr:arabinose operon transcriptional regulator AraC [Photobacterium rosenbergii]MDV5169934.1 arabinose operon transcriptional regulator AraC [Photobacterium rosenbergii]